MKNLLNITLFIAAMMLFLPSASSGEVDPNPRVEAMIDPVDRKGLTLLVRMGADIDGVWGTKARIYIRSDRLKELTEMGYRVSVRTQRRDTRYDDYHSYEQMTVELKAIAAAHPDISRLYSIGKSYEGRDLWVMKISDNPDEDEDEPEFQYISTMHGDEPVGTELSLNLIHLLAESYGTDTRITELVNDIEIWIMPLMNPDGYVNVSRYNAQGKDLNRSFPDRAADIPSPYPTETQVMMDWELSQSPVLSANLHTGATVVNYPYDSDPDSDLSYSATPDDGLFRQLALAYSSSNPSMYQSAYFDKGITNGVEWYYVYGGMQDWNYLRLGAFQLTIELYDTKMPPFSQIPAIWEYNRESMLKYMEWSLKGIRGIVTDSDTGKPLKASVNVIGNDHIMYTDPDVGDYHRILVPGIYRLQFSADGYVTYKTDDIVVSADKAARADIRLSPVKPGDIDGSGSIDLADAVAALRVLAGVGMPVHLKADVNGDHRIGLEEAVFILQTVAGLKNRRHHAAVSAKAFPAPENSSTGKGCRESGGNTNQCVIRKTPLRLFIFEPDLFQYCSVDR